MTQREIKFRGWLPSIKAMVYEDDDLKNYQILGRTDPGFIMQYTSLKDKNGKEIYEGDIVMAYKHECVGHDSEGRELYNDTIGTVFYEGTGFVF